MSVASGSGTFVPSSAFMRAARRRTGSRAGIFVPARIGSRAAAPPASSVSSVVA